MIKLQWEELENVDHCGYTHRAEVLGGWLIKYTENVCTNINDRLENGFEWRTSVTFVPDINHEWN